MKALPTSSKLVMVRRERRKVDLPTGDQRNDGGGMR